MTWWTTEQLDNEEYVKEYQKRIRNVETLKKTYDGYWNDRTVTSNTVLRNNFAALAHAVIDRAGAELLQDARFLVTGTPSTLVFDPYRQINIPVVVKVTWLDTAMRLAEGLPISPTDEELVSALSNAVVKYYQNLFNVELRGGSDNTPTVVVLYDLLIPVSSSDKENIKSYGFLTRFAIQRIVAPSLNYDEGAE